MTRAELSVPRVGPNSRSPYKYCHPTEPGADSLVTLYRLKLRVADLREVAEQSGIVIGRKRLTKNTLTDLLLSMAPDL